MGGVEKSSAKFSSKFGRYSFKIEFCKEMISKGAMNLLNETAVLECANA